MQKIELLSPAGDMNKLKTAFYFGADAVYIGGKSLSLRALAGNFDNKEIEEATTYAHLLNKKIYVAVNIFGRNSDVDSAKEYFEFLEKAGVDGAIISDTGLIALARECAPNLKINLSTQANTLNYKTVEFWHKMGVKRVILARELSIKEVKEIHEKVPEMELEIFIHGAMCISYSGRCLLSDYLTGRSSNRGACVQACRWNYSITPNGSNEKLDVEEDSRGTYILNSKDLNLMNYIDEIVSAGVCSVKIEGRMKTEYYLATVVNAYRRALDDYYKNGVSYKDNPLYRTELDKTAHREFTTAYFKGENHGTVNYSDSQSKGDRTFIALVTEDFNGSYSVIEMRNRFFKGDELEVLSPYDTFNKKIKVEKMENSFGEEISDAKVVQEKIKLYSDIPLKKGDMLRK